MALRPLVMRGDGRLRQLPLDQAVLARGIEIALAIPGDYMIYAPGMGGLYIDGSTLGLVNFQAGFSSFNINNDGTLTFNTNPVWHDGNRDITTFIRTTGNQIITGFLDIVGDLVGTRVQSYDGTFYGSTNLFNAGPAGFSGVNGRATLRPDGIGSDLGMLDVTTTDVKWDGKSLLKQGDVPLKLTVGTRTGVFNIPLTSTYSMAIGLRAGGTFNVQATT